MDLLVDALRVHGNNVHEFKRLLKMIDAFMKGYPNAAKVYSAGAVYGKAFTIESLLDPMNAMMKDLTPLEQEIAAFLGIVALHDSKNRK